MDVAESISNLSPDAETKVGSVLLHKTDMTIIATGYNGFVRGAPDNLLPVTRPEKYNFIVHSEENILAHCARLGISTKDCILLCTLTPCVKCMRLLYQAGVKEVIAKNKYRDFDAISQMVDIKINVSETTEGFLRLVYG
jgi:dCMP deaminase